MNDENHKDIKILKEFVDHIESETEDHRKYVLDKIFRFFTIDLIIFPIVFTAFSSSLEIWTEIFALISFLIGIIWKFEIIVFKLKRFHLPLDLFDKDSSDEKFLLSREKEQELLNARYKKVKKTYAKYEKDDKMILQINRSIIFSFLSILIIVINVIEMKIILSCNPTATTNYQDAINNILFTTNLIIITLPVSIPLLKKILNFLWKKVKCLFEISLVIRFFANPFPTYRKIYRAHLRNYRHRIL